MKARPPKLFLGECPLLGALRPGLAAYWVPVPLHQLGLHPLAIRRTSGGVVPAHAFEGAGSIEVLALVPPDAGFPSELDAVAAALAVDAPPDVELHCFAAHAPVAVPFTMVLVRKGRSRRRTTVR